MQILGYELKTLILVMATAIGSYGGMPTPPPVFENLTKALPVQWALVFVLIYQGGGGQDLVLTGLGTVMMFSFHQVLTLV